MSNLPLVLIASMNTEQTDRIRKLVPAAFFVVTDNGEKALEQTIKHKFNIIYIDSELNEMNGYECTLLLLGAYHSKDIPVIFTAPDNDKTAKWRKFNEETSKITLINTPYDTSLLANEIKRFISFAGLTDKAASSGQPNDNTTQAPKVILAVDDMSVNLVALDIIIGKLGHTLFTARSGSEALELCKEHRFDLIFMDCQMPGMDGFETTAAVKELYREQNHTVPIIALTAHAHRIDREKCMKAGMHDYLTKPVVKNDIINTVNKWTA